MSQVEEIERAVKNLPDSELRRFREWFDAFDARKWDAQIEADASSGKLDALADAAIADHKSGHIKPL
ncbi:hypothetical protein ACS8Y6_00015 [Salinisphaera sp. RV14]|uniref:hypothetical protein n=1 Tax=unclassified Salinisphaera TaxID=2649847 RepID=UPI003F864E02